MKLNCVICGKEFEGRANAKCCSGACRIDYKKQYNLEYRYNNQAIIKEQKRKWYAKKHDSAYKPKEEKMEELPPDNCNGRNYYINQQSKIICRSSKWGRSYYRRDRLEQIVMLSAELSESGIARLSYGYLSAIRDYDKDRYLRLLSAVVVSKEDAV